MNQKRNGLLTLLTIGAGIWAARAALRPKNGFNLRDKVVLITGGSRGLGLALAREFARHEARVVICGRDPDTLKRAQRELADQRSQILSIPCDVTIPEQVSQLVHTVNQQWRRIDVVVNNAGTITVGPMEVMTHADYQEAMNLHFWAPLYTTLAVLPGMRQRGEGRIVNIASVGGKLSVPHLLPYCASKFALVGLSEGLRSELIHDGIHVTTVCPGLMRTGSPQNAQFKGQHQAEYAWFSISDALPLLTVSAENAARQIVRACKRGQAELVISVPAKVAVLFESLFPEAMSQILAAVNQVLPGAGGVGSQTMKGRDSTSAWSPSWLTTLNEAAAKRNNEVLH